MDRAAAIAAFEQARRLDPAGRMGAGLHLARLGGMPPATMPDAYVTALFDDYAPRFERHLVEALGYRGPAAIMAALVSAGGGGPVQHALDLGCGTGLMGQAIRASTRQLDGLDLSPAMVEEARRLAIYDRLDVAAIADGLAARSAASHDLILAADVLVYVGDLAPVMALAARVLTRGGLFAFTLQHGAAAPVVLGDDLRFAHSPGHARASLGDAGLTPLHVAEVSTRRDAGRDVPGLVVVAGKA